MNIGINRNISELEYHAFPAISKSTLWKFAKNPAKWHKTREIPFVQTDAMIWGSLVDCLILQPHELAKCFSVSPFSDFRTKDAQTWRKSQLNPVITSETLNEASKAAELVKGHHFAGALLDGADTQVSCVGPLKSIGVGKCRLDLVPQGEFADTLVDLKTTNSLDKMPSTIADFGYHVQAAWYLDLYNLCTSEKRDRWKLIFQESSAPYEIAVVELDRADIAIGRAWYLTALEQWRHSIETGHYPSPWDDEVKIIGLPYWAKRGAAGQDGFGGSA
jgi:hypothetical protein